MGWWESHDTNSSDGASEPLPEETAGAEHTAGEHFPGTKLGGHSMPDAYVHQRLSRLT